MYHYCDKITQVGVTRLPGTGLPELVEVIRGVTVSASAFLACHQCYCAGSSLALGLNLWVLVCVAFSKARREEFSPGTPVSSPPSSVNGSASKTKLKKM